MIENIRITHQTRSFKIPPLTCVKLWTVQRRGINDKSVTSESCKYIKSISERSGLCLRVSCARSDRFQYRLCSLSLLSVQVCPSVPADFTCFQSSSESIHSRQTRLNIIHFLSSMVPTFHHGQDLKPDLRICYSGTLCDV